MRPVLTLLYRGTLSSCNYDCHYCPFAKRRDSRAAMARDAREVARFVAWVGAQQRPIRILFTPWGEALVRKHYQKAMLALSAMPQVTQVAIQTNLAAPLTWLKAGLQPEMQPALQPRLQSIPAVAKLALWCTFHPGQTTMDRFLARCATLREAGVAFSVGMVALREHFDAIAKLRAALPGDVYLWLNAFDRRGLGYYRPEDVLWLEAIDPWFGYNRQPLPSRGKPCRAGEEVLSVDGDGELTRCHFLPQRLGNLYADALETILQPRPCTRHKCDCFIGYVHRRDLPLYEAFEGSVLARIPGHASTG
jgi:MoaA/NifB/PqqE/SkfB family radical SAM enzyme